MFKLDRLFGKIPKKSNKLKFNLSSGITANFHNIIISALIEMLSVKRKKLSLFHVEKAVFEILMLDLTLFMCSYLIFIGSK